ncbi:MAG: RNA-binding protein [Nitrospirota bacterium]
MSTKLYVGNLSFQASESEVKDLFSQAGEVESVRIILDSYTDQPRGFGFVEMSSKADAEKAIAMFNGKEFMGRALTVNEARPQQKRERFGERGSRGGKRGRR